MGLPCGRKFLPFVSPLLDVLHTERGDGIRGMKPTTTVALHLRLDKPILHQNFQRGVDSLQRNPYTVPDLGGSDPIRIFLQDTEDPKFQLFLAPKLNYGHGGQNQKTQRNEIENDEDYHGLE